MGTKAVSPPTLPPAELTDSTVSASLVPGAGSTLITGVRGSLLPSLEQQWLTHQLSGPASSSCFSITGNTFFSLLVEERKVKKTSRRWKIYGKASFRWKRWTCCTKLKLLDFFNVLVPVKSCRRGSGKWWASPWGEDQHEGEERLYFKACRLWFRRRKWNLLSFLFTSHSRSSC